jgi:hypothetical protein
MNRAVRTLVVVAANVASYVLAFVFVILMSLRINLMLIPTNFLNFESPYNLLNPIYCGVEAILVFVAFYFVNRKLVTSATGYLRWLPVGLLVLNIVLSVVVFYPRNAKRWEHGTIIHTNQPWD